MIISCPLLRLNCLDSRYISNVAMNGVKIKKNTLLMHSRMLATITKAGQTKPDTSTVLNIFDRQAKILQRERATLSEHAEYYGYLKEEIGYRLADRIFDIKKKFNKALDLGCGRGYVSKHIHSDSVLELVMCDNSEILISEASCGDKQVKTSKVVCDEENLISVFEPNSFDLVISNLVLHWVNQLPHCFQQVSQILKPDGVFMGAVFGGETLFELRSSLQLAESERNGGISPHISPFAQPRDIGGLLTQAGFVMQTIDIDDEVLTYATMFDLLHELKGMGESNAAWNRCLHLSRDTLIAASVIYEQLYKSVVKNEAEVNENNECQEDLKGISATFQVINFIGWKPDPSQPQCHLPRGSAEISLRDFFKDNNIIVEEGTLKVKD